VVKGKLYAPYIFWISVLNFILISSESVGYYSVFRGFFIFKSLNLGHSLCLMNSSRLQILVQLYYCCCCCCWHRCMMWAPILNAACINGADNGAKDIKWFYEETSVCCVCLCSRRNRWGGGSALCSGLFEAGREVHAMFFFKQNSIQTAYQQTSMHVWVDTAASAKWLAVDYRTGIGMGFVALPQRPNRLWVSLNLWS
jgi:hypothetical protein